MTDTCTNCEKLKRKIIAQKENIRQLREMKKESSDLLVLKAKKLINNMTDGPARDCIIGLCNKLEMFK